MMGATVGIAAAEPTSPPSADAETNVPPATSTPTSSSSSAFDVPSPFQVWMADVTKTLPFLQGLEINPQFVTSPDNKGSTFGISYQYNRDIVAFPNSLVGDLGVSLHSDGLFLADRKTIPHNVFTHSIRFSWIDILPPKLGASSALADAAVKTLAKQLGHEEDSWADTTDPGQKNAIFNEARKDFQPYGDLTVQQGQWYAKDKTGREQPLDNYLQGLRKLTPRAVFLSADLNGDIEHDQSLTNLQFVGGTEVRGKLIYPIFDWPFSIIRKIMSGGDGQIKDWHNLAGGPDFWGGVGIVDGSHNDARKAVTTEHELFPRANAGVYYRNELWGLSETESLALELNWSFYYEFNAPSAIRAKHFDTTSYFKATLLLPFTAKMGNAFVEYAVGRLPVDVSNGQTVSVGWRYNF